MTIVSDGGSTRTCRRVRTTGNPGAATRPTSTAARASARPSNCRAQSWLSTSGSFSRASRAEADRELRERCHRVRTLLAGVAVLLVASRRRRAGRAAQEPHRCVGGERGARRSARRRGGGRAAHRSGDAAGARGASHRPEPQRPTERCSRRCSAAPRHSRPTRFRSARVRRTSRSLRTAGTSSSPTTPATCASIRPALTGSSAGRRTASGTCRCRSRSHPDSRRLLAVDWRAKHRSDLRRAGGLELARGAAAAVRYVGSGRISRCTRSSGCSLPGGRRALYVYGDPTDAWVERVGSPKRRVESTGSARARAGSRAPT